MNKVNLMNHINLDIRQIIPSSGEELTPAEITSNIAYEQYLDKSNEINELNINNVGKISDNLSDLIKTDDDNLKGIAYASIAGIYNYNGNFKNSLASLNSAANLKVNKDVKALIFFEYGNLLRLLNRPEESIAIFNESLKLTENENLKWQINTYIGYTLKYAESNKALKLLNKSADYYLKNTNFNKYSTVLRHIGMIYGHLEEYKKAKKYVNLVKKIAAQYSLEYVKKEADNDFAWYLVKEKNYKEAKKIFSDLVENCDNPYLKSLIYQNLAVIEFELDHYSQSINFQKYSLELTSKYQMHDLQFEDYFKIGLAYEKLGDYGNAKKYYKDGFDLLQQERKELGVILLTGYRKSLMDNYIRFMSEQPQIPTAALHDKTFGFTNGKPYRDILDVFQENLLKIHRRINKTIEQLCKSLNISLRLYFVYQNRFGLTRLQMKEEPDVNPHFKNYLFSLVDLDWKSAKNKFDTDLYRFLLIKHNHNKTNIAKILDVSNLTVIKKTAELD